MIDYPKYRGLNRFGDSLINNILFISTIIVYSDNPIFGKNFFRLNTESALRNMTVCSGMNIFMYIKRCIN